MRIDGAIGDGHPLTPRRVDQLVEVDSALASDEHLEQPELLGREFHALAGVLHFGPIQIDLAITETDDAFHLTLAAPQLAPGCGPSARAG